MSNNKTYTIYDIWNNRFDICEAYLIFETEWHKGGWLRERKSNRRRMMSTAVQLSRMGFKPSPLLGNYEDLEENGKAIYQNLLDRYGFREEWERIESGGI